MPLAARRSIPALGAYFEKNLEDSLRINEHGVDLGVEGLPRTSSSFASQEIVIWICYTAFSKSFR